MFFFIFYLFKDVECITIRRTVVVLYTRISAPQQHKQRRTTHGYLELMHGNTQQIKK